MVVITIVAVLSSIGFVTFGGIQSKTRDTKRKQDLKQLSVALEIYRQTHSDNYFTTNTAQCDPTNNSAPFYSAMLQYMSSGAVPVDPSTQAQYCYYSEGTSGKSFRLFAKLENCSDPAVYNPTTCVNDPYNFTVISPDLQIASAVIPPPITLVASAQSVSSMPSWSQDCGNGANRMLIVTSGEWRGDATSQLNGLTYAGAALTKLGQVFNTSGGALVTMWYKIAPSTGINNIISSASSTSVVFGSSCWQGVSQVSPANLTTAFNYSTTPSITVPSTTITDMVVDGLAILCANQAVATPGSGQSPALADINACNPHVVHSKKTGNAASTTMSWTLTGSEFRWAQIGTALKQAP